MRDSGRRFSMMHSNSLLRIAACAKGASSCVVRLSKGQPTIAARRLIRLPTRRAPAHTSTPGRMVVLYTRRWPSCLRLLIPRRCVTIKYRPARPRTAWPTTLAGAGTCRGLSRLAQDPADAEDDRCQGLSLALDFPTDGKQVVEAEA